MFNEEFANLKLDSKIGRAKEEAKWIIELIRDDLDYPPNILDLGCGRGRLAIELSALGARTTGLDINSEYIELAYKRAAERDVYVDFKVGDDRELLSSVESGSLDVIASLYTSFGYHSDEENLKVLDNCSKALRNKGILVLEVQNRDNWEVRELLSAHESYPSGVEILMDYSFDYMNSRKNINFRYLFNGEVKYGGELDIRLYSLHELSEMCKKVKLFPQAVYGSSRGGKFLGTGEKIVLIARKLDNDE